MSRNLAILTHDIKDKGFAVLPGTLSPVEVERYLRETTRLYAMDQTAVAQNIRQNDADFKMYAQHADHIFNLARKTRVFDELYQNPVLMQILAALLGENFILAQTEIRRPKVGAMSGSANSYHRDGRFIADDEMWVTAFWPLEDVTAENGPTVVLPGSHRNNMETTREEAAVPLLARPGDLIIMNSNVLHKSAEMQTTRSRWVLIITYCRWYLKPAIDHTRYFNKAAVNNMSPTLRQLFGYTSIPPSDERKRMYTCRPWDEIRDELDLPA
jgi:ectoine hydroxylase-related dioxygenase (phytanoyl-CoA dioxygenase family)